MDLLYRSYSGVTGDRLAWRLSASRLRILCYHGICEDRVAGKPWLPSYFVAESAFERQLQYLRAQAVVLPLSEAIIRLQAGTLPPRTVSITFDDGYANNLYLAKPLLERYGFSATVFLATMFVETGEWYPFLQLKLLRLTNPGLDLPDYRSTPVDDVRKAVSRYWPDVEAALTVDQRVTLRPLTIAEVRAAGAVLEFGAHSHSHGIARNEQADRRRLEVQLSVRKVAEWSGRPVELFSYPNGEAGDFGWPEKEALRAEGVSAAVTGIAGANRWPCDPLALRRYPLTVHHDESRFRAEVTGLRSVVLSVAGGRR